MSAAVLDAAQPLAPAPRVTTRAESEREWLHHREGVLASLRPAPGFESVLAERAALLLWRLRRVAAAEAALFDRTLEVDPGADPLLDADPKELARLLRYEAHLGRELARALKLLAEAREGRVAAAESAPPAAADGSSCPPALPAPPARRPPAGGPREHMDELRAAAGLAPYRARGE